MPSPFICAALVSVHTFVFLPLLHCGQQRLILPTVLACCMIFGAGRHEECGRDGRNCAVLCTAVGALVVEDDPPPLVRQGAGRRGLANFFSYCCLLDCWRLWCCLCICLGCVRGGMCSCFFFFSGAYTFCRFCRGAVVGFLWGNNSDCYFAHHANVPAPYAGYWFVPIVWAS